MTVLKDLKEALSSARKADTTHVRRSFQIYTSRPCEYGSDKYVRANYRRPTDGVPHEVPTAADFVRYRQYLRAARDHIDEALDAMEMHLARDPELKDLDGMKRAAYAIDTDTKPGDKVGPSLLPHVAPACASLNMAITQATDCGLLPKDPGTPWITGEIRAPIDVPADLLPVKARPAPLESNPRYQLELAHARKRAEPGNRNATPMPTVEAFDREIASGFGDKEPAQ